MYPFLCQTTMLDSFLLSAKFTCAPMWKLAGSTMGKKLHPTIYCGKKLCLTILHLHLTLTIKIRLKSVYLFLCLTISSLQLTIASYKPYTSQTNKFSNILIHSIQTKKKKHKNKYFLLPWSLCYKLTQQYEQNDQYTCNMKIYKKYQKKNPNICTCNMKTKAHLFLRTTWGVDFSTIPMLHLSTSCQISDNNTDLSH